MIFSLRIDIESEKGIKKGLPNLLNLLSKYDIKASFYLVMGGESNILELLKYRKRLSGERKIKAFSKREMARMILLPKDFIKENRRILKRILEEGHEIGIHGWKHRAWTRALERIDIEKQIDKSLERYIKIFGKKPKSFCSPAFRTNKKVLDILNKKGFEVISDLEGDEPFNIPDTSIINVPITIKGENKTPIIEYLVSKRYSDEEILHYLKKEIIKREYSIMYIHGLFEGMHKINLLERLFKYLKENKIKVKTIEEISKDIK